MKNWILPALAIAMGVAVTAALLVYTNPSRTAVDVYALARSVAAGDVIAPDALRLETIVIAGGATSLFKRGDEPQLQDARAAHDLVAGDLLQRGDVAAESSMSDRRFVLLPVKDAPPAVAGQKVDLFTIGGTQDAPSIIPFALGVPVESVVSGGLVVAVPSKEASAFLYAA
jgi:hypothetical protein